MNVNGMFVIWSFEHKRWWRPNSQGYTELLHEAGRYGSEEAGEIVTDSVFLDEVAILNRIANATGEPKFHPYRGEE
jgi:hypothetical protein